MKNTNSLTDEIRQERAKGLEGKDFSYKFRYYLDYYKWYVLGGLVVLLIITSIVKTVVTRKDSALCVALVGASFEPDYEVFIHEFEQISGIDDKHEMSIASDYAIMPDSDGELDITSQEKLFVTIAAGQTDVIVAPADAYARMTAFDYMLDLRDVMTEEELDRYKDRIYIAQVPEDVNDPASPTREIYAGIDISGAHKVTDERWYAFTDDPVYFGLAATSVNRDMALEFFEYLWE